MESRKGPGPSIIDTLSAGFGQVNKIIWIMLLPIVMDILLWRGPMISVAPVVNKLLAFYAEALPAQLQQAQMSMSMAGETVQSFEEIRPTLQAVAERFNLLSLLIANIAVVPSIGFAHQSDATWVYSLTQPLAVVGMATAFELAGVFLGVLYLGMLAQQVRDGRVDAPRLLRMVPRYWLSVVGFLLIVLGVAMLLSIPAGILVGVMYLISAGLGAGLMTVLVAFLNVGLMLGLIYLFFLTDAIVISEVGPVGAVRNSVKVVARNFWSALGLIVIMFVIGAGTRVIWEYLAVETWGLIAAIVGNAYIASGLAAASMLFYKTRLAQSNEAESLGTNRARA